MLWDLSFSFLLSFLSCLNIIKCLQHHITFYIFGKNVSNTQLLLLKGFFIFIFEEILFPFGNFVVLILLAVTWVFLLLMSGNVWMSFLYNISWTSFYIIIQEIDWNQFWELLNGILLYEIGWCIFSGFFWFVIFNSIQGLLGFQDFENFQDFQAIFFKQF